MKKLIFLLPLLLIIIISCKKEVDPVVVPPTTEQEARDYLYTQMNLYYLWYDKMPVVKKEEYKDPYELLEAMRYQELDRWSYIQTYEEYQAQSTGSFVGHGISMGLDNTDLVRIVQIYKNSPLYSLGVRRGWIVKKLNNTALAPIFIAKDGEAYNTLIGPSTAGITNTFLFQTPAGKDSTISSQKSAFIMNTVITADTLHLKSGITGHLVFDQFISPSNQELKDAFTYFSQNNIKNLIVDLRYNGGGDLSVLTNMASYVAGSARFSTPFLKLTFNNKNTRYNVTYNYNTISAPLSISKLIVITSRGTASASEDFINGLKPVLDVKTIGDTTNGKPVGMIGIPYETEYMFWPISFTLLNASNQGDFYNGIPPMKVVGDDYTRDWNDKNEAMFKEAIYYLENGTVSAKSLSAEPAVHRHPVKFDEKSSKSSNAYIISE